ncbi:MAG: nitroreductase family deazaflavin-dependent oxidoreductase [Armatimonadota bacterium]|nr:nitroreductase family deazaflavin-dependent oxidoreductase [Armatimonadota bacterium]
MRTNVRQTDAQFLYLTTIGRKSGLPRQIEIWFVYASDRFYLLAERGRSAAWVRNVERHPRVTVRLGSRAAPEVEAVARVLDQAGDAEAWQRAQELARRKYGWGDGWPVEITPVGPAEAA